MTPMTLVTSDTHDTSTGDISCISLVTPMTPIPEGDQKGLSPPCGRRSPPEVSERTGPMKPLTLIVANGLAAPHSITAQVDVQMLDWIGGQHRSPQIPTNPLQEIAIDLQRQIAELTQADRLVASPF